MTAIDPHGDEDLAELVAQTPKANPGSHAARVAGCTCPIIDNHYGRGIDLGHGRTQWVTEANCPLHGGGAA